MSLFPVAHIAAPFVAELPLNVLSVMSMELAHEYMARNGGTTRFKGFEASQIAYQPRSFECTGCSNLCEVVEIRAERQVLARWGGRCGKWEM